MKKLLYTTAIAAFLTMPLAGNAMAEGNVTKMNSQGSWQSSSHSRVSTPADLEHQTVAKIQQSLEARGYNVGPIDGVWGNRTESALENFQNANGLEATGRPDSMTLANLGVDIQAQGKMYPDADADSSSTQYRSKTRTNTEIDANVDTGVDTGIGGAEIDTNTKMDTDAGVGIN